MKDSNASSSNSSNDNTDLRYDGSFSVLHEDTGLNLTMSAGLLERDDQGPISMKSDRMNKCLIVAILSLVTATSGCMVSIPLDSNVDWVAADEHRITVASEIFESTMPIRVKYTDVWQTEEYVLFKSGDKQLEIIYAEADKAFTVALDYQMPIDVMVATWNLNTQQNLDWGPLGRIDSQWGTWFFRTYEHSDLQRSCVGFQIEWEEIYEDPQRRPGKVLFGYYCAAPAEALEDNVVHKLIRGVSVRMQNGLSGKQKTLPAHDSGTKNPLAVATAGGNGLSAQSGNASFPFLLARYYSTSNGGRLD